MKRKRNKPGAGAPVTVDAGIHFAFRVNARMLRQVDDLARQRGVSNAQIIRLAIEQFLGDKNAEDQVR